jgi:hypothetical protein
MAVENRGGMRPNAPQNNPANINPLGGNGQSGSGTQAATYIPGMGYGQGKALMQQQEGAKLAGPTRTPKPSFNAGSARMGEAASMAMPLTAPSAFPDEKITTGAAIDSTTAGPEALIMPGQEAVINDPDLNLVREYFPVIELWASQIDTSQGTKDYVNYLRTII